jgi:hypothetical protein
MGWWVHLWKWLYDPEVAPSRIRIHPVSVHFPMVRPVDGEFFVSLDQPLEVKIGSK